MFVLNNLINNLIPDRFKVTYELNIKVRGFLISQLFIGALIIGIGFLLGYDENDPLKFYLNIGIGLFLIFTSLTLHLFRILESYINLVLTGGYFVIFSFILISGGIFADEIFILGLLLAININYTKPKHILFWSVVIALILTGLSYYQSHGLILEYIPNSITERFLTLFIFFMLLLAVTYSYSLINKKKNSYHLEIIAKHKRLLKERDDLMNIISHDIKSPSQRIEGLISIFSTDNLTKDQKEILDRLAKTAHESKQLIDDLIEATSFQENLAIEKTSINEIINDLKAGFLPLASKKDIKIITLGLRHKIFIETSSYQLKRILDNLLSNAIKFSPLATRVEITCLQNDSNISISIKDQGPGFNEDDESRMFKKFQKLTALPTGDESSTGLGLSIVKNLSELLKGKIKYVTQVGKGSTFTLVLPNKFPQESDKTISEF